MYLCCVESLSSFQSKLDFLQNFKVTQKSSQRPWTLLFFKKWPVFLNAHNSKIICRNQLKLSTQHKDINMYQKM